MRVGGRTQPELHEPVIAIRDVVGRWAGSMLRAKRQELLLVLVVCAAAIMVGAIDRAARRSSGNVRGADFLHFYTLGHLASSHRISAMYDMAALHEAQVALVPESKSFLYPAVYPPQIPVLFTPFAGSSYQTALLVWSLLTIGGYALILWSAWKPVSALLPERGMLMVAAAAFPPFWMLVMYGQITILILAAFWAGWMALERGHRFVAGAAFALLALKPQFGIPLAVVVLAGCEWAMLSGALASVAVQSAVVWMSLGAEALRGFASTLPVTFNSVDLLEAKPIFSHSLRALTRLLPNAVGVPLWFGAAGCVLWYTVRVWKSDAPIRVRVGIVMLASLLVNPHVIVYDATVLALPLLWFAAYAQETTRRPFAAKFWKTLCWLFVAFLVPIANWIGLQVSVLLMIWLLVLIARAVLTPPESLQTARAA
jgi:alpha-1,2-mannosyltransferase